MQNLVSETYQKFNDTLDKLNKGQQVLSDLPDVEIGITPKEQVFQIDKVKLYRYQNLDENGKVIPPKLKVPIVIQYALINRYDMMDLQSDRTLIGKLISLGADIYIIDTGYPTRNERYLTMDDYINLYMDSCINYVCETHKIDKVNLLGVCQGGTFSIIYSSLHPEKVNALITMVTPVDFSKDDGLLFRWSRDMDIDAIVEGCGGLIPGGFLDFGFQTLKPMLKVRKNQHIMNILDNESKMLNFLRMEKWINDQPAQAGETYRQFLKDLYQQNKLVKGELVVGEKVDLKKITMPLMNIYAASDHLVPPSATIPLNDLVGSRDKELYKFPGGHIGVFTGRRSQKELTPTIFDWLSKRDK